LLIFMEWAKPVFALNPGLGTLLSLRGDFLLI
jgi:hypothetical protein